jgi:hypothetical protein
MGAIASATYKGWKIKIYPCSVQEQGFFSSLKPPGHKYFFGYNNYCLPTVADAITHARRWIDRGSWQPYRGFLIRAFPCPQADGWCWELIDLELYDTPSVWSWELLREKKTYPNRSKALMKARRQINQLVASQMVAHVLDDLADIKPELLDSADCDRLVCSITNSPL